PGYYNPYLNQPMLSPYLNLVRNGNNGVTPGINYFLGTLPEIQRRSVQAVYGQAINQLQREVTGEIEATDEMAELRESGHPASSHPTGGSFASGTAGGPTRLSTGAYRPPAKRGR